MFNLLTLYGIPVIFEMINEWDWQLAENLLFTFYGIVPFNLYTIVELITEWE